MGAWAKARLAEKSTLAGAAVLGVGVVHLLSGAQCTFADGNAQQVWQLVQTLLPLVAGPGLMAATTKR